MKWKVLFCLSMLSPLAGAAETTTPIHYIVILFQENVSFDHYFGTYPHAENRPGELRFDPAPQTPAVNGLSEALRFHNPNKEQPVRLSPAQAVTCDQDHDYTREQQAANHGRMDKFVEFTEKDNPKCDDGVGAPIVMGYYDGNTVTALWTYAQHFALSDNFFDSVFGPSTPGALNLISGQTHGATLVRNTGRPPATLINGTVIGDPDPAFDDCASPQASTMAMEGKTVGDLLNARGVTWGWFHGGFAVCASSHTNVGGASVADYSPHHEPFQYYAALSNPHHLPPSSIINIGRTDQAHHQYDLTDFWHAAAAGTLPAVSFLKAEAYQDGHAGYSDPLDEQRYLIETINALQRLRQWHEMAVFIAYDDSDGWYDHMMPPTVSHSQSQADALTATGACGTQSADDPYSGRCGYGPRLPLLAISPWARRNYVDHTLTDQTSLLRFIEDNWKLGRIGNHSFDAKAGSLEGMFDFQSKPGPTRVLLNPETGLPLD